MTPQVAHTRIVCTSAEGVGFNQSWTLEVVGGLREDVSHKEWEGLERTCRIWTGLPSPLRESLPRTDARTLEVGGYKAPPSDATTSYARPTARRFSGFAADDGPGMRTAGGQTIVIHGADLGPRENVSAAAALPGASGAGSGSDGRGVRSPVSAAYQVSVGHVVMWCWQVVFGWLSGRRS